MKINVLMSTFNGERYLSEQLDSIAGQTGVEIRLHVRDDGSVDSTCDIIGGYRNKDIVHEVERGDNIGFAPSFFRLLASSDDACRYFAFADQDDWWHPGKLQAAVAALRQVSDSVPALYCGRLACVDRSLQPVSLSPLPTRPLALANALVENVASGCTIVINRAARRLLVQTLPGWCLFHDWWCYLLISAVGRIIYDERPFIKYRLHGANDTGAPVSFLDGMQRRIRRFAGEDRQTFKVHRQATEFVRQCGAMLDEADLRLVNTFLDSKRSVGARLRYGLNKEVYRQRFVDDMLLRLLICWGRY
ncbi:MAG: glycosyltransferase family 2 protein [Deltaproteobacteria bacterium]|nr:glycosyltransferase family 2 protein [Deltaproteobacteria bacterium]